MQRDCLGERAHHLDLVGGHRGEPHVGRAVGDPLVDGHVHGHEASSQSFLTNFENFLLLIRYLFVPWTAVNLVDYYVVRRGHYAIAEIFNPRGIYLRWSWRGIAAYVIAFGAMVPFFSTPLYTGPVANALGGADI